MRMYLCVFCIRQVWFVYVALGDSLLSVEHRESVNIEDVWMCLFESTFAMSGALAWQVTDLNKEVLFLVLEGDGTGLSPGSPSPVSVCSSRFSEFSPLSKYPNCTQLFHPRQYSITVSAYC